MVRKDGSILSILLSATLIKDKDGNYLMSRSTMIDNSEQKKNNQAIKDLNISLQQHLAELEQANEELEAFTYSVSHDLRAPLRAIKGYTQIIADEYATKIESEGMHYIDSVQALVTKMDQLILGLLSLSRVSRAELTFTPLNMNALVRSVIKELIPDQINNQYTISIDPLPVAYGDMTLIRQVWSNLISNAIKYTAPKEEKHIDIGCTRDGNNYIYFIKDNGVGYDPDFSYKLFTVFQRLHNASDFEGIGAGLAIVKRIIQRHGGKIWSEGKVNKGASFYFTLPAASLPKPE